MAISLYSKDLFTEDQMAAHPVKIGKAPGAPQGDPKKYVERQKYLLDDAIHTLSRAFFTQLFPFPTSNVLNCMTVKELHLTCGDDSSRAQYLAQDIAFTETILGRTFWMDRMIHPLTDNSKLLRRQKAIKSINPIIQQTLNKMTDCEGPVMSFWDKIQIPNCLSKMQLQQQYIPQIVREYCNLSSLPREAYGQGETLKSITSMATTAFAGIGLMAYGAILFLNDRVSPYIESFVQRYAGSANVLAPHFLVLPDVWARIPLLLFGALAIGAAASSWTWFQADREVINLYHEKMTKVATFFISMKTIYETIKGTELEKNLEHFANLTQFFSDPAIIPFIKALEKLSPTNQFYQSMWHPMLISLSCLQDKSVREKIEKALIALAEIDCCSACEKLILKEGYSFAQYTQEECHIEATNLIHPRLKKAKPNSMRAQYLLIRGDNGSGKSMLAQAIAIASLMAGTLGIAPAESFKTPLFANIFTSLHAKERINEQSHYQEQKTRAEAFLNEARTNPDKKYLFAMDEAFNGANADNAHYSTNNFLNECRKLSNVACLFATHDTVIEQNSESWVSAQMVEGKSKI